jgi:hypothetical protein
VEADGGGADPEVVGRVAPAAAVEGHPGDLLPDGRVTGPVGVVCQKGPAAAGAAVVLLAPRAHPVPLHRLAKIFWVSTVSKSRNQDFF